MAKRRNLKKEKAQRNLAYARKFRKRSNSRYGRNRRPMRSNNEENGEENDEKSTGRDGEAAT
jgi:hypothetical protein